MKQFNNFMKISSLNLFTIKQQNILIKLKSIQNKYYLIFQQIIIKFCITSLIIFIFPFALFLTSGHLFKLSLFPFHYYYYIYQSMKTHVYEYVKLNQNRAHTTIGFGAYGEVKLARDVETQNMVAIKLIYGRNAQKEISVHYKLKHTNIIALLNDYYDQQKNITYMVMEYADGGTLYDKIKNSILPKDLIKSYFFQICEAIQYLHQNKLIHRDIKPQNVLLTKKNQIKICDFGFATLVGDRMSVCGTYQYMSPEMIKKISYDQKVDIWALGILLFQMIQGTAPFRGDSAEQVIESMKKSIEFSEKFTSDEISLIKMILRVNTNNRPSIYQILQHKYFQKQKPIKDILNLSINSTKESEKQLILSQSLDSPLPQQSQYPKIVKNHSEINEIFYKPSITPEISSLNSPLYKINKASTQPKWQQLKPKINFCKSIEELRQKKKF